MNYDKPSFFVPTFIALALLVAAMFFLDLMPHKTTVAPVAVKSEDTLSITEEQYQAFPNWKEADKIVGDTARFTEDWCRIALEQQFP